MKLGTLLLRDDIISLSQLEDALRAQIIYGGRLGTNLVDLNHIDLDTLGDYIALATGYRQASRARFEAVSHAVIKWFSADLAEQYTVFPLGFEADSPESLGIALADPEPAELEELTTRCGHAVSAYVAPELRIFYYLEKHYKVSRKARFVRCAGQPQLPTDYGERRRSQAPHGVELPPAVRLFPKTSARAFSNAEQTAPRLDFAAAASSIAAAEHRDDIGEALIDFAVGRFGIAVVFVPRDANALGWRFYSAKETGSFEAVQELGLPLGGASVLQASFDSKNVFRGTSPSAGRPVEKRLWQATGTAVEPVEALVVPVVVADSVINLIYVHGWDGAAIVDEYAAQLAELGQHAGVAYARLIQASQLAAHYDQKEDPD